MAKKIPQEMNIAGFAARCVHCEHHQEKAGTCCFCHHLNVPDPQVKSSEEHHTDLEQILTNEIEI